MLKTGYNDLTAALDFIHGKFTVFNGLSYDDILNSPNRTRILNECVFDINYLCYRITKKSSTFMLTLMQAGLHIQKEEIERVKKLIA